MKHFILVLVLAASGLVGLTQARDRELRWVPRVDREAVRRAPEREENDRMGERGADRFMERRERLRALREEMLRPPPAYRNDEPRRQPLERRDMERFMPPPARETEGPRRFSPEERRQFRRQLHEAGRDVYRDQ